MQITKVRTELLRMPLARPMHSGPIEYMPWVAGAFSEPARIKNGHMIPPQKPGLRLEIPEEVIRRYRMD